MSSDETISIDELQRLLNGSPSSLQPLSPEEGVERYLNRREGEMTEGTLNEYRRKLAYFLEFCELRGIGNLNEFGGRLVDDYRVWRRDEATERVESLGVKTMRDEMYLFKAVETG